MKERKPMTRRQRERLGYKIAFTLAAGILVVLIAVSFHTMIRKVNWSNMLLDMSYSTASVGGEGVLEARHGEEPAVRVCYANARRVQSFIQNAGLGQFRLFAPDTENVIVLDYHNGTIVTLTEMEGDRVYMEYESPRREFRTALGYMVHFSDLSILVSEEGANDPNRLWEEN